MQQQVTWKGTESTDELTSRVDSVQTKLEATVPDAQFAKYVVERNPRGHAVGLAVTLADGHSWVRHAEGPDWERAFLEMERRLDRLAETEGE